MMITKGKSRLAAAALAGVPAIFGTTAASAEPIKLKGMTPWTKDYPSSEPFFVFQRLIEERLGDKVTLEYLGGPEVTPAFEQFEALRNGVVDVILGAAAYYTSQVPEASAMLLARTSPQEQRESGYYDLMRQIHRDKGDVIYLSNLTGVPNVGFRLYVNKMIDKADLTGMKIRVSPVYVPLVEGLGGTPVNMPTTEIYTALERGVVDGYGQTYMGIMDFALHEVTKYVIDVPFYSKDNAILMNAETWDGLPEDVRAELDQIAIEVENEMTRFMEEKVSKENDLLREAGLEFIELDEAETKKYLDAAYDKRWADMEESSPEFAEQLKKLGG
ncbi:MAG: TRAP transporter substrate-binding protein DctP [Gammaproteobacteria bacterium]|nr:TRAP transporter substrate-binding protein DctP [Gammaproteobacteria bacterium]